MFLPVSELKYFYAFYKDREPIYRVFDDYAEIFNITYVYYDFPAQNIQSIYMIYKYY